MSLTHRIPIKLLKNIELKLPPPPPYSLASPFNPDDPTWKPASGWDGVIDFGSVNDFLVLEQYFNVLYPDYWTVSPPVLQSNVPTYSETSITRDTLQLLAVALTYQKPSLSYWWVETYIGLFYSASLTLGAYDYSSTTQYFIDSVGVNFGSWVLVIYDFSNYSVKVYDENKNIIYSYTFTPGTGSKGIDVLSCYSNVDFLQIDWIAWVG